MPTTCPVFHAELFVAPRTGSNSRYGLDATVEPAVSWPERRVFGRRREARSNQASAACLSRILRRTIVKNFNFSFRLR